MQGNTFIRYLLEGCLDISICTYLQFWHYQDNDDVGMRWDTTFEKINSVSSIVLAVATCIFPLFIIVFYCLKFTSWEDDEFD